MAGTLRRGGWGEETAVEEFRSTCNLNTALVRKLFVGS